MRRQSPFGSCESLPVTSSHRSIEILATGRKTEPEPEHGAKKMTEVGLSLCHLLCSVEEKTEPEPEHSLIECLELSLSLCHLRSLSMGRH